MNSPRHGNKRNSKQ